jgi:hypothetical protein
MLLTMHTQQATNTTLALYLYVLHAEQFCVGCNGVLWPPMCKLPRCCTEARHAGAVNSPSWGGGLNSLKHWQRGAPIVCKHLVHLRS